MLTENMKLWHGLVIAMVSLVLQACLLVAINCLLSRHMAKKNEQLLKRARLQAPRPSPSQHHSPASQKMETRAERSTPVSEPHYRHGSDTSSDSSDTSDSASSSPPTCQEEQSRWQSSPCPGPALGHGCLGPRFLLIQPRASLFG
ncbi:regulator of hemoglobinization and erythroid cell expansion protein isoform X2 [Desmodus rotundus]|uniref:regulator of hemoglobinization and erythroid cell expansion protein isoform X2 n=1 Tax=Desmodus rotundus TaxID=9430 RepID=UPI0023816732|nr:regulator of hemoglobinization and erythroid cell expansion protein isoform X2 [Desmodus rotundus]